MSSGLETMRAIDSALAHAKAQAADIGEKLQIASAELMAVEREVAEHYRSLARVRVSDLAQGDVLGALDEAEQHARALLERRATELTELKERKTRAQHRKDELEGNRSEQSDTLSQLTDKLDSLEAEGIDADISLVGSRQGWKCCCHDYIHQCSLWCLSRE